MLFLFLTILLANVALIGWFLCAANKIHPATSFATLRRCEDAYYTRHGRYAARAMDLSAEANDALDRLSANELHRQVSPSGQMLTIDLRAGEQRFQHSFPCRIGEKVS